MRRDIAFDIAGVVLIFLIVFTVFLYPMWKYMNSSGKVEWCYIKSYSNVNPVYDVYGFREWREDLRIAHGLNSVESAKRAAVEYGCELK